MELKNKFFTDLEKGLSGKQALENRKKVD